jgi:hypothetical protein
VCEDKLEAFTFIREDVIRFFAQYFSLTGA